jgi:exonuclease VII large subunit
MVTADEQINEIEQSIPQIEQRLTKDYEKFLQQQQKLLEVKALLQRYRAVKEAGDLREELKRVENRNASIRAALEAKKTEKNKSESEDWFKVEPSPIPGKCIITWGRPPSIFPDDFDDDIDWKPVDVKRESESERKCSDCGVDHHYHDHDIN